MSSFNHIERALARVLSKVPYLKRVAKAIYSRLVYIKHKKKHKHQTTFTLKNFQINSESFFGYYDKSPANPAGLVLGHLSASSTSGLPEIESLVKVALFSQNLVNEIWSANVFCFNWQQGARLHWLDDDLFIYNDFDMVEKRYISKVVNSKTLQQLKSFVLPVQDSFGTDYFLSINYRRLISLRPDYGYRNLPKMTGDELKNLVDDGIWRVDFKTGQVVLLVSLAQICEVEERHEFTQAFHKVNHVMISPLGSHFIFLHRYLIGQRRFDRLILADAKNGKLKLLSDYGMVSHYFWMNDKTILGFMRGPNNRDAYWLLDIDSGSFTHIPGLDGLGDGHPHVHGDLFVTDTYPNKSRMQQLNLINWKTGEVKNLGEFFHSFEYSGETRCDLHPRFSPCGKKVYFDSVFSGKRALYEMDLAL